MPMSQRSLVLSHDSSTGHSLPGASPLGPLIHMGMIEVPHHHLHVLLTQQAFVVAVVVDACQWLMTVVGSGSCR